MVDVTSFETTQKLLDAGFPNSTNWGHQYYIKEEPATKRTFWHPVGSSVIGNGGKNLIRACSALDIVRELGRGVWIRYDEEIGEWECYRSDNLNTTRDKNSAEAIAKMYLIFKGEPINV